MNADFEVVTVCLDTPPELPDLAARIEHTAPADIVVSPPVPVDWQAVAIEYRDLADFFKAQAYQTAAQLAQARQEAHQFRQRLIATGLYWMDPKDTEAHGSDPLLVVVFPAVLLAAGITLDQPFQVTRNAPTLKRRLAGQLFFLCRGKTDGQVNGFIHFLPLAMFVQCTYNKRHNNTPHRPHHHSLGDYYGFRTDYLAWPGRHHDVYVSAGLGESGEPVMKLVATIVLAIALVLGVLAVHGMH